MFSEHASVVLFECLVVAGAPATGLLQDVPVKGRSGLQTAVRVLRDMWQRADVLHVQREDLESLHRMECNSSGTSETPIPERISTVAGNLSRYYIYLLFRYCVTYAGATKYSQRARLVNRSFHMFRWEPRKHSAPLVDVPENWLWLGNTPGTSYPSAPPIPDGHLASAPHAYPPSPLVQQLPRNPDHEQCEQHRYPRLQKQHYPQSRGEQQVRAYREEIDYTQQRDRRFPLHSDEKQLYPSLAGHGGATFQGPDARPKLAFGKGCHGTELGSEDGYCTQG